MDEQAVIDHTRRWISSMVIELNLCPFARRVFDSNTIRYVVTATEEEGVLIDTLTAELQSLAVAPIQSIETTLLLHPCVLRDFFDYNDFFDVAERLIVRLGLEGVIQLAGFHPDYQFAETTPEAVENYTNRSPYPMLHLLREDSITAIANDPKELLEIPKRNIETLKGLGREQVLEKLQAIARDT